MSVKFSQLLSAASGGNAAQSPCSDEFSATPHGLSRTQISLARFIWVVIFAAMILGKILGQAAHAAINDFNSDQKSDLIFTNKSGQVDLWLMNGVTATSKTTLLNTPDWSIGHIADFNGDGKADIL